MNRKYPTAALALIAASFPGVASANTGPWTTSNPGGVTWTAPNDCTLQLDLTTWDGYPSRVDQTQAYELVVVYRNGTEIGRTVDLKDKQASWTESKRITAPVSVGDVVTVRHSSLAGLLDGTQNSVNVSASFTCPPPAPTTTAAPTTTLPPTTTVAETLPPTTVPETTTTTAAPATTLPPTTVAPETTIVAVDIPPTLPPTTTVIQPPRTTTVSIPLPETGPDEDTRMIAHLGAIVLGVGSLLVLRASRRAVR